MGRKIHRGSVGGDAILKLQNVDLSVSTTVEPNKAYWCNTSASAFTLTLPGVPAKGDIVRIFDAASTFDTNNLTIARNGQLIMGLTDNVTVDTEGAAFDLVYYNASQGWRIYTT